MDILGCFQFSAFTNNDALYKSPCVNNRISLGINLVVELLCCLLTFIILVKTTISL